ncbi:MAG TPA: class I SAM-dependent methyltransferase [Candidatus Hydrogenedentes bacterium]|nr:class I SAM-dependent methyltransferase [Candidatus Hydrogenedentota bacterium]
MPDETPWHDDDKFWALFHKWGFSETRWAAAGIEAEHVLALTGQIPPLDVLDMCCGVGRHCIAFAKRQCRVVGVDRTPFYLAEARARAESEGLSIEFVQDDMRRFARPGSFDLALSLYTSFSYFEAHEDNMTVLRNLHASLRPGGMLVIEMMGKEVLARKFSERDWSESGEAFLLHERHLENDWSRMANRWIFIEKDGRYEATARHWLYSATELANMLSGAGFASTRIFGALNGAPYDQYAERLVTVSRK